MRWRGLPQIAAVQEPGSSQVVVGAVVGVLLVLAAVSQTAGQGSEADGGENSTALIYVPIDEDEQPTGDTKTVRSVIPSSSMDSVIILWMLPWPQPGQ